MGKERKYLKNLQRFKVCTLTLNCPIPDKLKKIELNFYFYTFFVVPQKVL